MHHCDASWQQCNAQGNYMSQPYKMVDFGLHHELNPKKCNILEENVVFQCQVLVFSSCNPSIMLCKGNATKFDVFCVSLISKVWSCKVSQDEMAASFQKKQRFWEKDKQHNNAHLNHHHGQNLMQNIEHFYKYA